MYERLTRRPGEFKAYCKLAAWRDVAEVLAMDPPLQGAYQERWNHALKRNEMRVPCDLKTEDRAEFEQHMADVHGRKLGWKDGTDFPQGAGWGAGRTPVIKCRSPKPSPGGDGRPFKPSAKAIAEDVWTCATCGLVAEVRDLAGERWRVEHARGCALAQAGAAS